MFSDIDGSDTAAAPSSGSPSEDALRFAIPPRCLGYKKVRLDRGRTRRSEKRCSPRLWQGENDRSLRDLATATKRPSARMHAAALPRFSLRRDMDTASSSSERGKLSLQLPQNRGGSEQVLRRTPPTGSAASVVTPLGCELQARPTKLPLHTRRAKSRFSRCNKTQSNHQPIG